MLLMSQTVQLFMVHISDGAHTGVQTFVGGRGDSSRLSILLCFGLGGSGAI